ncbi:hypothetical protein RDWZM_009840 [Blomia tropicalis]|uniref:CCHC-type domain-containing protein n=1 Tax=Blomia tropicalis TaxID=40697 RepID=A0A9Q0LXC1_BLOTA|nr:hypothetical protein RDWZM_009840 [Blomia tropicalis]
MIVDIGLLPEMALVHRDEPHTSFPGKGLISFAITLSCFSIDLFKSFESLSDPSWSSSFCIVIETKLKLSFTMAKPVTRSKTREQPEIQDLEGEQPSRPSVIPAAPNMQSFMSTASTSRSTEPTSRTNEKAPTIRASDLPNFDGKVLNWLPFKLVFSRVVLNEPSISDAQKLGLLIKVTSGRALNRVVALTQRELSTEEIFNSLEDYFHSNTKVEECLSQMVRKLPFVSNYYDLAQFEEMLWQFRDLESICSGLGPEYEARANAMIGQILRKFGYELRRELSTCSTLEEMEEKMTQLYESAMRLTEADDSQRYRSHPNRNDRPPSSSSRGRSNHSRSVVAAVTASPQCQLCPRAGHASAECNATLSHDEKKRLFSEKSLCFKCAEPGHRSNVCPNRNSVRCSSCQSSHPSVLHGVRFNSSRPNQQSQSPAHSSSSNNVIGAVLPLVSSVDQIVAPIQPLSSSSDVCHARYIGVAPLAITIDRPAFSLSLNNRKIVAWLDTCSPYTMIRKALVDPNQTFPCRGIRSCGYSGGPISSSATKINIMIEGPNFVTKIEAYVMEVLPFCDMLIGTDMLSRLSKWDQSRRLKFETGFGDIHFGPVGAIQPMENSEDVDDDMLDMNVTRLDNGTFEASLPFLSDVRPASNYDHVLRLTSALINRLIRNADKFSRPANPSNYLITKPWILDLSILPIEPSPITVVCAVTTKGDSSDPDILEFLGRLPSSRSMVAWVRKWLSWIPAYRKVPSLDRAFIVLYRLFQRGNLLRRISTIYVYMCNVRL